MSGRIPFETLLATAWFLACEALPTNEPSSLALESSVSDTIVHASTRQRAVGGPYAVGGQEARAGQPYLATRQAVTSPRLASEQNTIDVFRAAAPATVFVTQKQLVRDNWTRRALEVPTGSGSGFVWDRKGHIVTNAHVVDAKRGRRPSYSVTLLNGESYEARLVGTDRYKDIAVLKVSAPAGELTPIQLPGPKSQPEVGQKALAIGNPFGLDHTLTVGVVSALGREVKGFGDVTIRGMIQTDASINPGNSGGPLLNSAAQLLGMNTIIYSKSGSSAGIGFAVPTTIIRMVVPQIIKYGAPLRSGLGVWPVDDDLARANGIRGVAIREVTKGSPAARAGLKGLKRTRRGHLLGDVIVGIEDAKVENYDDLYTALDTHRPGEVVEVVILRNDRRLRIPVKLTRLTGGQ
ncbi:MAG: trypsin-like peptidase domain-containing protein [Nannocystaceae bacterium]